MFLQALMLVSALNSPQQSRDEIQTSNIKYLPLHNYDFSLISAIFAKQTAICLSLNRGHSTEISTLLIYEINL